MIKPSISLLITFSLSLLASSCKGQSSYNGHQYVDLGLSVKWATCNIGATVPEGYGDYYAWGETETYYEYADVETGDGFRWKEGKGGRYGWESYFDIETITSTEYEDEVTFKKYKTLDKILIDPEDDAAHVIWGGNWRMPTKAELDELADSKNCAWTWTTINGIKGYKVTSKKPDMKAITFSFRLQVSTPGKWIISYIPGLRDDTGLLPFTIGIPMKARYVHTHSILRMLIPKYL